MELSGLLPIFIAGIGLVVWLVRLEGKVLAIEKANIETQKDVDALRVEHNALNNKTLLQLAEIRESLARIEGRLSVENHR